MTPAQDKRALRRLSRARRAEIMGQAPGRLSASVCEALLGSELFGAARTVAAYLAYDDEVDLGPLLAHGEKRFVVPRVDASSGSLRFHPLQGANLVRHRFGQLEPDGSTPEISASDIDLVLVPGLAFDVGGGRLGYGGGYYDRLLASLPGSVPTVGVTLDELIVDAVPVEPHDVGVSHLVTQSGLRLASAQRRTAVRSKARS